MHQRQDDRDRGYFGVDVAAIVERILDERLTDGGWNCEVENGSVRSSFDTTINVLDGLLECERATGGSAAVREARRGGEEYLLERGLFRRKSTGEVVDPAYLEFAFPYYWRYDALRALDYFRRSGVDPDPRMAEAVEVVRSSGSPTAGGCSTASIRVASTSTSRAAWGRRAAGTPSARSGCSSGGTGTPDVSTKVQHARTPGTPEAPLLNWAMTMPVPPCRGGARRVGRRASTSPRPL